MAELGEQHPHVAERTAGHARDRVERARSRLGTRAGGEAGAVGLGDHDRERVRDDVVHVAGDAVALLLDRVAVLDEGAFAVRDVLAPTHLATVADRADEESGGPRQHEHRESRPRRGSRAVKNVPHGLSATGVAWAKSGLATAR